MSQAIIGLAVALILVFITVGSIVIAERRHRRRQARAFRAQFLRESPGLLAQPKPEQQAHKRSTRQNRRKAPWGPGASEDGHV